MKMLALAAAVLLLPAAPAAAPQTDAQRAQAAIDQGVAEAEQDGIEQGVAIVDRATGTVLGSEHGDEQFISESITKLFTVGYYELQDGGDPPADLAAEMRTMIIKSDDGIESDLWRDDIVPTVAAHYGLPHTANGPKTGPHDWGWELITPLDETKYLYDVGKDPQVGPFLSDAMANVSDTGDDGFDQDFGLNALDGDVGSKQGWTDVGSSDTVQIHSVGWVGDWYVAILQTSDSASYDAMRAASTRTAELIQQADTPTDADRAVVEEAVAVGAGVGTEAGVVAADLRALVARL
jgi:hypothetical protein